MFFPSALQLLESDGSSEPSDRNHKHTSTYTLTIYIVL